MGFGNLRRGGEEAAFGFLRLLLKRDNRFEQRLGRALASLRRPCRLFAKRGELGLKIRTLLVRDKSGLAEIDRKTLGNIVDPRQPGEQAVHPLPRDVARSRELVVRIGDHRGIAGEFVAAFIEPHDRIEAELLDDPCLFSQLFLCISEMEAQRVHRLVQRQIFGAQCSGDAREPRLFRPSRAKPEHPDERE